MTSQSTPPEPVTRPDPTDEKSDLRVVMQFFIVPLVLVIVLVSVFFGLQFMRHRQPDPGATLQSLRRYDGFLSGFIGDLKRWQYGYDLSLLIRADVENLDPELVPELIAALSDSQTQEDLKLRRYLTLALGSTADPRGLESLAAATHDEDAPVRLYAVWGLMRTGESGVAEPIREALDDPDPGVRKMAIFAAGEIGDGEAGPRLRRALTDDVPDVVWNAALSLARLGDPAAVPVLLGMLAQGVETADSAAETATATAVPSIGDRADDAGVGGRELALNAIRGLAILKPRRAVEPLQRLSKDRSIDPGLAAAAALALEEYGDMAAAGVP